MKNEEELVAWLRRRTGANGGDGIGIGDDCALLPAGGPWAVTVDAQIAGVHVRAGTGEATLARRLLAVNLSDLAAVGARPAHAFLALAAPRDFDHRRYLEAMIEACENHGLDLAGGDLAGGDRYHATLTLLGTKDEGSTWLRRDVAEPGDRLYLGGPVGLSALGLRLLDADAVPEELGDAAERCRRRHLAPLRHVERQLRLGRELAKRERVAAIDVSDGVAKDLRRLCTASEVGALLDAEAFAPEPGAEALARHLGADARELALHGGEDYVLLFTLPAADLPPKGSRAVGRIVREEGLWLEEHDRRKALEAEGYDHLA